MPHLVINLLRVHLFITISLITTLGFKERPEDLRRPEDISKPEKKLKGSEEDLKNIWRTWRIRKCQNVDNELNYPTVSRPGTVQ